MNKYSEEYKTLEGLYFWCKIAPKVRAEGNDEEIEKQFKSYAEQLDKLGVSWKLQNSVAYAATLPENRDKYFDDVLKVLLN